MEGLCERLKYCFAAHDIKTEAKKRATVLRKCGMATYKLIKSLPAQQKPSNVEYKVLLEVAKEHFTSETVAHSGVLKVQYLCQTTR